MSVEKREWTITSLEDNDDGPDVEIIGPDAHLVNVVSADWAKQEIERVQEHYRKMIDAREAIIQETNEMHRIVIERNVELQLQNQNMADEIERLRKALSIADTRIEGMILSLEKHGQNIDPQFHIEWLRKGMGRIEALKAGQDE